MAYDLLTPGGGLTKSKLLLANAQPDEVFNGKTFYSNGEKVLKTGTMNVDSDTAIAADVISGKTFHAGDKNRKTGQIPDYGYEPVAKSCSTYNPGSGVHLYMYLQNADTSTQSLGGKITRSLRYPKSGVLSAMGLQYSGNWEVIGFGGHMGYDWGTSNLENAQRCITWANGWSANLPQGTYRVLVCFGQGSEGGVDLSIKLGGSEKSHAHGTYWNCDDVTFTGSGALVIKHSMAYRNPSGVVIVVLHQF